MCRKRYEILIPAQVRGLKGDGMTDFQKELEELLNRRCKENESNTPDFILAQYLVHCLNAFNLAVNNREFYYNRIAKNKNENNPVS